MFDTINQFLFGLINAPNAANDTLVMGAKFAAEDLIYIVVLAIVLGWVLGKDAHRRTLFGAGLAAIVGLLISSAIRGLYYNPRPFAVDIGQQYLEHDPTGSFPSNHGTFLFSIALALLLGKSRFGPIVLVVALATAWARVYLGVHWPLDMLGAFAVAMVAAPLASTLFPRPLAVAYALALGLYRGLLNVLHLPLSIFPR